MEALQEIQITFDQKQADMMNEFQRCEAKRLRCIFEQNLSFANSHDFLKGALDQIAVESGLPIFFFPSFFLPFFSFFFSFLFIPTITYSTGLGRISLGYYFILGLFTRGRRCM